MIEVEKWIRRRLIIAEHCQNKGPVGVLQTHESVSTHTHTQNHEDGDARV